MNAFIDGFKSLLIRYQREAKKGFTPYRFMLHFETLSLKVSFNVFMLFQFHFFCEVLTEIFHGECHFLIVCRPIKSIGHG